MAVKLLCVFVFAKVFFISLWHSGIAKTVAKSTHGTDDDIDYIDQIDHIDHTHHIDHSYYIDQYRSYR